MEGMEEERKGEKAERKRQRKGRSQGVGSNHVGALVRINTFSQLR